MSTAFTAALPLLEKLKKELDKLDTATKEIAKDREGAALNKQTADAAMQAANAMERTQRELVANLDKQHRTSLGEQELLLRTHAADLTAQTADQITRQLAGLHEAAGNAQRLIDKLLEAQPPLLADMAGQQQRGLDQQREMLQKATQAGADALHQQMQAELKLLRQVTETLQKNTRQQHDELSAVANQLQIVAGRVTAFAEVMNAAKFTTRLETIEHQQQKVINRLEAAEKTAADEFKKLTASQHQQHLEAAEALKHRRQQAAEEAGRHKDFLQKEINQLKAAQHESYAALQNELQNMTLPLVAAGKRQQLLQWLVICGLMVVGIIEALVLHKMP